jgi:DNA phosphorothioation-associated putative methyltransferase
VVNLGFVLNVIDRPEERVETLRDAWALAGQVLVIAVRPEWELRQVEGRRYGDGVLTVKGTFQKFFGQEEIRALIETVTGVSPVAAAPGVFYVFRDEMRGQDVRARLIRTRVALPPMSSSESRFQLHRDVLAPLIAFVEQRGRLPLNEELPNWQAVERVFGSVKRAFTLVRRVEGDARWAVARTAAEENLIVFLALAAFRGRPRMMELSEGLRADIKALFGNYKVACRNADAALFGLGDRAELDRHLTSSPVGKVLPDALYVHATAVPSLDVVLRLYEGCARSLVGDVPGGNVVKLGRGARRISYLAYPEFDRDPHPRLHASMRVDLQSFGVRYSQFTELHNPPVLHRKEMFVTRDYPRREIFRRLSDAEEKCGLLKDGSVIGTLHGWNGVLSARGLRLSGHRLVRADTQGARGRDGQGTANQADPAAEVASFDEVAALKAGSGAESPN